MSRKILSYLLVAQHFALSGIVLACEKIEVDCASHTVKIDGQLANDGNGGKINCGMSGHVSVNGSGKIGGVHSGAIVPNGVEIEGIQGMGASGGGKVFHTPNPRDESSLPKGENSTHGCIAVSKLVLEKLRGECKGKSLAITGADGRGGEINTGSTNNSLPTSGPINKSGRR